MVFDPDTARAAFAHVFETTDGSSLAVDAAAGDGLSAAFLGGLVDSALGSAVGHTGSLSTDLAACTAVDPLTLHKVIMYGVLGSFASTSDDPAAWVKVGYNPSTNRLQLLPSAAETRQMFSDVLVVLSIVALFRTWVRRLAAPNADKAGDGSQPDS